jgi:hypothetical protein
MDARYLDNLVSPVIAGLVLSAIGLASLPAGATSALTDAGPDRPIFKQLPEVQWAKMLPELGEASPEMAILHEDPKTHATQLLIRSPKALHVFSDKFLVSIATQPLKLHASLPVRCESRSIVVPPQTETRLVSNAGNKTPAGGNDFGHAR